MYVFHRFGFYFSRFIYSIIYFISFIGHLFHSWIELLLHRFHFSWVNLIKIMYYSGVRMVLPLTLINGLLTFSIGISIYSILKPFMLQNKAFSITQSLLTQDLQPLVLGFVICIQSALNLINARIKTYRRSPQEVILEYILPAIVGMTFTVVLLYIYTIATIFISLFFTFHHIFTLSSHEFILLLSSNVSLGDLIHSFFKTLIYCAIVSFTAGFYYYEVAMEHLSLRRAISRIVTRGSIWLAVASVYMRFLNF